MMKPYRDIDGDSGISAYEYGDDYISVQFKNTGKVYSYHSLRIGGHHLETMKRLADSGDGLNSYIMRNPEVKKGYS